MKLVFTLARAIEPLGKSIEFPVLDVDDASIKWNRALELGIYDRENKIFVPPHEIRMAQIVEETNEST